MRLCTTVALLLVTVASAHAFTTSDYKKPGVGDRPATAWHRGGGRGGGAIWNPPGGRPKDILLAGKPCTYTPAVLDEAVWFGKPEFMANPLLACNDTRLSAKQQASCLKCIGIRRRSACLATVSDTFWGADEQSCTWVGEQPKYRQAWQATAKTTEVRYSLGINVPYVHGLAIDNNTCRIDLQVELMHGVTPLVFPTALFLWQLRGLYANGSYVPASSPLNNEAACTLRAGSKFCRATLARPAYLKNTWLLLKRDFWTNRLATVQAWQKTNSTCLNQPAENGTCSARPEPFKYDYTLKVVQTPCKPNSIAKSVTVDELPFAQPGHVMYPGGDYFYVIRSETWLLQSTDGSGNARKVEWSVRVPRNQNGGATVPMFVGVLNTTTWASACKQVDKKETCNYGALTNQALPGTACYGRDCRGRLTFNAPPKENLRLVVAYPRYTYYPAATWIINTIETPAQTVVTSITAYP